MLKNFNIVIFILLICYFLNGGKENFGQIRKRRNARKRRKKYALTKKISALTKINAAVRKRRFALQKKLLFSSKSMSQFR